MSYFKPLKLTRKGELALLGSNGNINKEITLTKGALGSEQLIESEIFEASELKKEWIRFDVNSVRIVEDNGEHPYLTLEITFMNNDFTTYNFMSEIGIFAKIGEEEFLFGYSTTDDQGETIPPGTLVPASYKITLNSIISDNLKINQTISPTGFLTEEVIELLKQNINNIAIQREQGTLTENQKIITFDKTSLLNVISNRLQLFIAGELMSLNIDYTVDTGSNRIILEDEYNFPNGTVYEVIDPLPPTYVKEEIDKFYKSVEEKTKESLEKLKNKEEKTITIIDEKKDSSVIEIDKHVKEHLQNLIGEKGEAGRGIESFEYISTSGTTKLYRVTYTDKTTTDLYISDGANGDSAYEIATSNGFEGTEEEWLESLKGIQGKTGIGIKEITFDRTNEQGDYIYNIKKDNEELAGQIISPRGPRGYTGGVVGEPQPPGNVPYGTIVEWQGSSLPEGWLYTNGGILEKKKYPHLSDILQGVTQPIEPYFKIDGGTNLKNIGLIENKQTWEFNLGDLKGKLYQDFLSTRTSDYRLDFNHFLTNIGKGETGNYFFGMTNMYYYIELPEKLNLSFIKMNKINATGNSTTEFYIKNKNVDVYFDIDYLDENGEWKKGTELHNKTDFIPGNETTPTSTAVIKSSFKSNQFRIIINGNSLYNFNYYGVNIYYIGELEFGFDKKGNQFNDFFQLPNEKDIQGRYKICYVGQPLLNEGATIYSYNNTKKYNGELDLKLAVNDKLPNYVDGITMSEPKDLKLGYTNRYNKDNNSWELIKTHGNKEGYYYDETGELKYISKRNNYSDWDNTENKWIINLEKKNIEKYKLQSKLIELEIKKEKFIEKEFETVEIEKELENIKSQLKEVNDESETEVL